jgi:endonuclease YncB( thermonuclease family)
VNIERLVGIAAVLAAVLYVGSKTSWFGAISDSIEDAKQETVISGPARVINGNSVSVAGTKIRLLGIDVAETGTIWGDRANLWMNLMVGRELSCRITGDKSADPRYSDWEFGYFTKPDGTDLAREMVAKGYALACPRQDDRYVQFEVAEDKRSQPRSPKCAKQATP